MEGQLLEFKTAKDIYSANSINIMSQLLAKAPVSAYIPTPVEWQEKNRYIPKEVSENYGQFSRKTVPHLNYVLNCLHPDNPATHVGLMKSVQSAGTTILAEGAMGFHTTFKLGSILFLTSTKNIGKIRSNAALDVLIDNSNLIDMMRPISTRMMRKTSDTTYYKEFMGGVQWIITSYKSIADIKSNPCTLIICDEWDEAPLEIANQGDIAGVIEGRTMAARQYKILTLSTPTNISTSRIYKTFIEGDQCRYFVPCPICGRYQILVLYGGGNEFGLTFNTYKEEKTGAKLLDPSSVRYICEHCKGEFTEASKQDMLEQGEWQPTWQNSEYVPKSPYHRSFHAQGLISPFLSWTRICQAFMNTRYGEEVLLFKDFTINILGNPWATQIKRTRWGTLYDRREEYELGSVPKGVLQLTGGADVHPDRIEVLVTGWGRNGHSWIVDHKVFYGDTSDFEAQVWQDLKLWGYTQMYNIMDEQCRISLIGIDQGFNPAASKYGRSKDYPKKPHIVQEFVAGNPLFVAMRGIVDAKELVVKKAIKDSSLKFRYDVGTDIIKDIFFSALENSEGAGVIHFGNFPKELFRQFCSEVWKETRPGVFRWKKTYKRNEALDMYIYSYAVAFLLNILHRNDVMWDGFIDSLKQKED